MSDDQQSRPRKWLSLVGIGYRRLVGKAGTTDTRRVAISIIGVGLAIGLMLVVTGIALGLAEGTTIGGTSVDYWIVPEAGSASTLVVSPDAPRFGQAHESTTRIEAIDGVEQATPVLVEMNRLVGPDGTSEYVLLIGVIPSPGLTIEGIDTSPLNSNIANRSKWGGEIVLSDGAATLLNADPGSTIRPRGTSANRTLTVVNVSTSVQSGGFAQFPIGVMHLNELQVLTGADAGDQADQFLVTASSPDVEDDLAQVYPRSTVIARNDLGSEAFDEDLPLAMSLASLLVALIIGTLFVGTMMGLEITADRQEYAVMGALGLPFSSQAIIVASQTLTVTLFGGIVGVVLGTGGIVATNQLAMEFLTPAPIARFHPYLLVYGVAIAVLIGVLAVPYLLWLSKRTDIVTELRK